MPGIDEQVTMAMLNEAIQRALAEQAAQFEQRLQQERQTWQTSEREGSQDFTSSQSAYDRDFSRRTQLAGFQNQQQNMAQERDWSIDDEDASWGRAGALLGGRYGGAFSGAAFAPRQRSTNNYLSALSSGDPFAGYQGTQQPGAEPDPYRTNYTTGLGVGY